MACNHLHDLSAFFPLHLPSFQPHLLSLFPLTYFTPIYWSCCLQMWLSISRLFALPGAHILMVHYSYIIPFDPLSMDITQMSPSQASLYKTPFYPPLSSLFSYSYFYHALITFDIQYIGIPDSPYSC